MVRGSFPIGGVTRLPQLCLALLASIYLDFPTVWGSSTCKLVVVRGVICCYWGRMETNNCSKYGAFLVREIKRYTYFILYVDHAM